MQRVSIGATGLTRSADYWLVIVAVTDLMGAGLVGSDAAVTPRSGSTHEQLAVRDCVASFGGLPFIRAVRELRYCLEAGGIPLGE